jgi:bis(5'-nucleosidyl)-tetraphosphatase
MILDASFGIIPLKRCDGEWQVLIINHRRGSHWGFPKGHSEPGEKPMETASRELIEETGLSVIRFISETPFVEHYVFFARGHCVQKSVTYFVAEVAGELQLQAEEIEMAKWVPLNEVEKHLTFKEAQSLCKRTRALVNASFG